MNVRIFQCYNCDHKWEIPYGTPRPGKCPECESTNIHRAEEDRGYSGNRGGVRGRGMGRGGRRWQNRHRDRNSDK